MDGVMKKMRLNFMSNVPIYFICLFHPCLQTALRRLIHAYTGFLENFGGSRGPAKWIVESFHVFDRGGEEG